jgi:ABC-type transport system involved in cytochrome bd biosynthesis fused ATPase/permease subunit
VIKAVKAIWDFVVGDDWRAAAGVVVILAATAIVGASGWLLVPIAVCAVLAATLHRAAP